MNFDQLISLIQATIAPAVLISGCGLLCLIIQTRYGRIIDRMRIFNQEHSDLKKSKSASKYGEDYEKRMGEIKIQMSMLIKRGNYLKLSLFSLFSGILSFILTSLLIFSTYLLNRLDIYYATLVIFSLGLVLITVGMYFVIREVATSYATILHDVKSEQY